MYASLFGISGALHLDVFDQPATKSFFITLPVISGVLLSIQLEIVYYYAGVVPQEKLSSRPKGEIL